jgi:spermidine/putrescine transport system permease protein
VSDTALRAPVVPVSLERHPAARGRRLRAVVDRWAVPVFTGLAILYLLVPILIMILFSFNDPPGRRPYNVQWGEFSLDAWLNPLGHPRLDDAVALSLVVAFGSTIIATALGTLIALALTRYRFRGQSATNLFIFIPMATPEIVLGASLLSLFVTTAQEPWKSLTGGTMYPLGLGTILISHVMFNISYVVVTVKARMQGFDRRLEEAAMDLGANEWTTFWKVTFPLIFPGIMAAAVLAFSLSIDDFIITNFTSGTEATFPILVWSSIRNIFPPQFHVLGTIVFVAAVGLVLASTIWQRRSERPLAAAPDTA